LKRTLRIAAAVLLVTAIIVWAATGANRGWTQTDIPTKIVDEVTGIEGVTYHKGFKPGRDFLGAAALGAGLLAGVSFLFRTKKLKPAAQPNHPGQHT
jgi:hypothetical protein